MGLSEWARIRNQSRYNLIKIRSIFGPDKILGGPKLLNNSIFPEMVNIFFLFG